MLSDKKQLILLIILIALIAIAASYPTKTAAVTISTDKDHYKQGETINILVENNQDEPILYTGGGYRFWSIEYQRDESWVNIDYETGFQLTEEDIGARCDILLYERTEPERLLPKSAISDQWNQKICPYEEYPSATAAYITSGTYRLTFYYGFEISENDPYAISYTTEIYSDTFTIE